MATNNFKAFGIGAGANVTSQADYEALAALLTGFQSGKASSAQINKALRQGTVMAAVLAQFIADKSGNDVLDNGNTTPILTNFIAALKANAALTNANYFLDSGIANAMVITPSPAITSLVDGQVFDIACAAINTGSVTLKVNGLNAYPVTGPAGALKGGEIGAVKGVVRVIWSATNSSFLLIAQNTSGPLQVAPATQQNHAMQLQQATGRLLNIQVITSTGNYIKTPGATKARARVQGGGGAGGGTQVTNSSQVAAASGGTAGAYGETGLIDVSSVTSIPVVVGSGGAPSAGLAGGKGGDSSFGAYLTAPGGGGGYVGTANSATAVAASGLSYSDACSGNSVAISSKGQGGEGPVIVGTSSSSQVKGGDGGSSYFGAGARAGNGADGSVVQSAQAIGSGGSGRSVGVGSTNALAGGNGAAGIIIVEEYA